MKKTYQIQRDIIVGSNTEIVVNFQLKDSYARCTEFFLTPSSKGTDFSAITIGLNVAQMEVLPTGTDASLFAVTSYVNRNDAAYKFAEEGIPARSSDVSLTIKNSGTAQKFNVYFVLEN